MKVIRLFLIFVACAGCTEPVRVVDALIVEEQLERVTGAALHHFTRRRSHAEQHTSIGSSVNATAFDPHPAQWRLRLRSPSGTRRWSASRSSIVRLGSERPVSTKLRYRVETST
nr:MULTISPECIES: hypothetical protein [unclassified Nannocystis]